MEESAGKSATIAALEKEVKRHLTTITEANSRIRDDELLRRKLHNTIQELKGEEKVTCAHDNYIHVKHTSVCMQEISACFAE